MSGDRALRRWRAAWATVLVAAGGVAVWLTYRDAAEARREAAAARAEADDLKMRRYHDALRQVELIGEATDNAGIRGRCQNAVMLLALVHPDWYEAYRSATPPPDWLKWSPPKT